MSVLAAQGRAQAALEARVQGQAPAPAPQKPPAPAEPQPPRQVPSFRTGVELVSLNVTVSEGARYLIGDSPKLLAWRIGWTSGP